MAKDPRRIISLLASAGPAPESLFVRAQFPALFPPHFPHRFLATQINALRMHPFPVEQDLLRTAGSRKNPCFEPKTWESAYPRPVWQDCVHHQEVRARKGWVPPSRSTSKFLMGWRGLSRSAAIIFRLILLQAAKFRIESLCDEIWVPKRDGKAAVGEYIDAAESVLAGSRGQAVTPIWPGIRIQWSSACRSDVERLYVEEYGSSPRSREQKLSVAAWSQTLPERLVQWATPWPAMSRWNCSLVWPIDMEPSCPRLLTD
jgi:hypothetical protein